MTTRYDTLPVGAMLLALTLGGTAARAELPPTVYIDQQNSAPEAVQIEVVEVRGVIDRGAEARSEVTATAKVVCIGRSASGLKPGETITIAYSTVVTHGLGWAGPRPVPILEKRHYPAFLAKAGEHFAPAAGGYSFSPPPNSPVASAYNVCSPR